MYIYTSSANPNNTQELDSNNKDLIENTQESNVNEDFTDHPTTWT